MLASKYGIDQNFFQIIERTQDLATVSLDHTAIFPKLHLDVLEPEFSRDSVLYSDHNSEREIKENDGFKMI